MMSTEAPTVPGLCLVATAHSNTSVAHIEAALDASRASTLILTPPPDGSFDPALTKSLIEAVQKKSVAVLLANDVPAARTLGADGVHLSWRPEIEDAYEDARNKLGPDAIVGADAGQSRHDAMTLGEAGADYVAFSDATQSTDAEPNKELQRELISWWIEVFVVPAVAAADTTDDVRELARLGTDFISVQLPDDIATADIPGWAAERVAALSAPVDAA